MCVATMHPHCYNGHCNPGPRQAKTTRCEISINNFQPQQFHIVKHENLIPLQVSSQYLQFHSLNEKFPVCIAPIKYVTKISPLSNVLEKICPSASTEPYIQTKFTEIHNRVQKNRISLFNSMQISVVPFRRFKWDGCRPAQTCSLRLFSSGWIETPQTA
jgi:hypothetical protein